ncbi:MAG: bifunctional phosphopantothenoylcysteine decarboxylase/phosphopantothenate--cysteine ligase CoaBC [Archangium gephyra]|uniref:Coenzyme A biosynthesis bifunctional protein CoaBC n=1 Tax=Archangium gephyra TaxID=48 RepID=A0A2W5V3E5_9BACT|nr:MAG: bifunctional phosphopantothenoylcysteine decarboxylase/phosphopantothenate--cysteine ligase CoaBC [Archangium gephyra]
MSSNSLQGKRIAVGVGGGIAAYKAGDFVRELRRQGSTVKVAMTKSAQEFITPLTMQSLSGDSVMTDYFDVAQEERFGHLHLARWADAFVVLPATADLIARIVTGMGNDAVTTSLLAFRGPVLLAPAMNTAMWENAAVQRNIATARATPNMHLVGPGVGPLADGDVGAGRLVDLPELIAATASLFPSHALTGKRVLVTAGPTRESMDPVRFISNPSTGKMGLAVADEAHSRGAQVTVVLGPVEVGAKPYEVIRVTTADEMLSAVMARVEVADVFVASAAVSDWKPSVVSPQKTKKGESPETLTLVRTPDVLLTASTKVHANAKRPLLVGFAAETHDVTSYAKQKLAKKKLDLIVANDVSAAGAGFGTDTNAVTIISATGETNVQGSKRQVASRLWDEVAAIGKVPADV